MATRREHRRFEIVPLDPADLDEVVEVERLASRSPWDREGFVEELARKWAYLEVLRPRTSVGQGQGRALAFINYWLVRDEVHILNLATHPDARRAGHAARLLEHVIAFGHKHRCRYLTLEVRRSNAPAVRLYRKYGFRPVGIRPNYYSEGREDAVVMLLELIPPSI